MKVEVHDLKHEKWFLEAEPTVTIGELKLKNVSERSLDESSNQKMIYSGKILKDTDTLSSINYAEGKGFIVCMVSKSRKPTPRPTPPPAQKEASQPPSQSASTPQASQDKPAEGSSSGAEPTPMLTGPSTLATGSQLNTIVANIMDMGYSQQQVLRALRKAYNNPDRAVEYLVTGQVPEETESADMQTEDASESTPAAEGNENSTTTQGQEPGQQPSSSTIDRDLFDAAEEREMDDEEEEVATGEDIDFRELLGLDDEQLNELRSAVRQNPHELLSLLDPLVRNNPQVAETLINNLDQFLWFLQSSGGPGEALGDDTDLPPVDAEGNRQIAITPEEEQAIYRLMELGFEFDVAAMAYLACDKDEQLTANYLLEHGHDE